MDTVYMRVLISKSNALQNSVCVDDSLLQYLKAKFIANDDDIERIKFVGEGCRQRNGAAKMEKVLEVVKRGGETGFYIFCEALEASNLEDYIRLSHQLREAVSSEIGGQDPDMEEDCTKMDSHMRCIQRYHRKELLTRAVSMAMSGRANPERTATAVRATLKRGASQPTPLPKPRRQEVINTMSKIPQDKLKTLQKVIDSVGCLADLARNGMANGADEIMSHENDGDDDYVATDDENDDDEGDRTQDNRRDSRGSPLPSSQTPLPTGQAPLPTGQTLPCLVNMSCASLQDDVGQSAEEVLTYLKWAGAVSDNARVRKYRCWMPMTVVALEDDSKLKTYDGQGSVLVKLLADIPEQRSSSVRRLAGDYVTQLQELLGGSPVYLQGFHPQDGRTVLLVQMTADSLQQLYELLLHNPGRLASKGILHVSTFDGSTVLSMEQSTAKTAPQMSVEDEGLMDNLLEEVKQYENCSVDISKIREKASLHEVVQELYEICDEPGASPVVSTILRATENTIKREPSYKRRKNLFTKSGTWTSYSSKDKPGKNGTQAPPSSPEPPPGSGKNSSTSSSHPTHQQLNMVDVRTSNVPTPLEQVSTADESSRSSRSDSGNSTSSSSSISSDSGGSSNSIDSSSSIGGNGSSSGTSSSSSSSSIAGSSAAPNPGYQNMAGASAFSSAALLSGERKFTSVMALATDVTPIYQNLSEAMATSTLESPSTYREPVCNVPPLPRRQFTAPAPTAELIPEPVFVAVDHVYPDKPDPQVRPQDMIWYHGHKTSRNGAVSLLKDERPGSFLLRKHRWDTVSFILSFKAFTSVMHSKIRVNPDGLYILGENGKPFPTLSHMITCYQRSPMPVSQLGDIFLTRGIPPCHEHPDERSLI